MRSSQHDSQPEATFSHFDQAPRMSFVSVAFGFTGRLPRSDYWAAMLALFAISLVLLWLTAGVDRSGVSSLAVACVAAWSYFAICAKRWHDRGKSGWWCLFSLIPLIGAIWMVVELGFLAGTPRINRYGPRPR